jgi:pyruvate ferredoxin oxidoreductase delta subunit
MKPKNKSLNFNIGAIIDEPGNMRTNKKVSFRNLKPVTDYSKCIKCGRCWMSCPDIAYEINKDGTFKNLELYCKGCGICANVCPVKCIKMEVVEQ